MEQPSLFAEENPIIEKLRVLELDELSPRNALSLLYEWKESLS
jgi:DNA mismatch repair protein MutS